MGMQLASWRSWRGDTRRPARFVRAPECGPGDEPGPRSGKVWTSSRTPGRRAPASALGSSAIPWPTCSCGVQNLPLRTEPFPVSSIDAPPMTTSDSPYVPLMNGRSSSHHGDIMAPPIKPSDLHLVNGSLNGSLNGSVARSGGSGDGELRSRGSKQNGSLLKPAPAGSRLDSDSSTVSRSARPSRAFYCLPMHGMVQSTDLRIPQQWSHDAASRRCPPLRAFDEGSATRAPKTLVPYRHV